MRSRVQYVTGLSPGRYRTRCVICALENDSMRFLAAAESASGGWMRDRLADPNALSDTVGQTVREAERRAGVGVRSCVLGLAGTEVQGVDSRGLYELGHRREIQGDDLEYVVQKAAAEVAVPDSCIMLQVLPQDFTVDGRAGYRNPRGLRCARLEAHAHIILAPVHEHNGLIAALHRAQLDVEETIFESVAAAYAAVLPEERNRGVALVDIGQHSTGVVVYYGESLLHSASISVSADHFTRDLAWGLRVRHGLSLTYEDAEAMKRECGCAILGLTADNSLIEVPAPDGRPQEIPCREINEILQARCEELFGFVEREIRKAGMDQGLLESIFLCGGGARLTGMCDMAEATLNCQARYALPVGIEDWPVELEDPAWTGVAGLAMYSARLKLRRNIERKAPGLLGLVLR
ncbi:MAG: cell division protein FtsA [Bryobacteraceae bacterium]